MNSYYRMLRKCLIRKAVSTC